MPVYHANEVRAEGSQMMAGGHEIYVNDSQNSSATVYAYVKELEYSYNLIVSGVCVCVCGGFIFVAYFLRKIHEEKEVIT